LELFRRLGNAIGFGDGLRALLIVSVLGLPLLALLLWRRWALVPVMAVFLAVSAGFAARLADDQARAVARTAQLPPDRSWVDDVVGKDANVVLLNTANFMPETARGDYFTVWAPWWETEFWNRSARTVYSLGSPEPIPVAHKDGTLDWATGVVEGVPTPRLVLSDPRFEVRGGRLRGTRTFVLYEPVAPLRLRNGGSLPRRRELALRRIRPLAPGRAPRPHRGQPRTGDPPRPRRPADRGACDWSGDRRDHRPLLRHRPGPTGPFPGRGALWHGCPRHDQVHTGRVNSNGTPT
jgi:hypothetical protein